MPDPQLSKRALLMSVIAALDEERAALIAAHRATAEGATHEENRAEGDKDMRSTEASYLARGQALRVAALDEELARLAAVDPRPFAPDEPVVPGAVVTLRSELGVSRVFLLPGGAGKRVGDAARPITVVTPSSPLGSALLGARTGDVVEVARAGRVDEQEVESVE
jgi:transcription elongation GreA/GreB family factor